MQSFVIQRGVIAAMTSMAFLAVILCLTLSNSIVGNGLKRGWSLTLMETQTKYILIKVSIIRGMI